MFTGKAEPTQVLPFMSFLVGLAPDLTANIRLLFINFSGTNTLAYFGEGTLTNEKSFMTLARCYKTFMSVIYKFS